MVTREEMIKIAKEKYGAKEIHCAQCGLLIITNDEDTTLCSDCEE